MGLGEPVTRFLVCGRGRSGTTVVADELDRHPEIDCHIEPFIVIDPNGNERMQLATRLFDEHGVGILDLPEIRSGQGPPWVHRILPYDLYTRPGGPGTQATTWAQYLEYLETKGRTKADSRAVGFKSTEYEIRRRPGLLGALERRGYRVVFLHRKNIVRTALSKIIANQRGVSNARAYTPPDVMYHVDPAQLLRSVAEAVVAVRKMRGSLCELGLPLIDVAYEDFLADRLAFYRPVTQFLGVAPEGVGVSDFTRMVATELRSVISNYDQVAAALARAGLDGYLTIAPEDTPSVFDEEIRFGIGSGVIRASATSKHAS